MYISYQPLHMNWSIIRKVVITSSLENFVYVPPPYSPQICSSYCDICIRGMSDSKVLTDVQGSVCGQLFAGLLHQLVSLSNACEPTVPIDLLPTQALEDLPLVEQIPVLHRLDHSVHTARLWAANTARHLVNAWSVDKFFVITQTDINLCLAELQMLKVCC